MLYEANHVSDTNRATPVTLGNFVHSPLYEGGSVACKDVTSIAAHVHSSQYELLVWLMLNCVTCAIKDKESSWSR